jgi:hypothetical protein
MHPPQRTRLEHAYPRLMVDEHIPITVEQGGLQSMSLNRQTLTYGLPITTVFASCLHRCGASLDPA